MFLTPQTLVLSGLMHCCALQKENSYVFHLCIAVACLFASPATELCVQCRSRWHSEYHLMFINIVGHALVTSRSRSQYSNVMHTTCFQKCIGKSRICKQYHYVLPYCYQPIQEPTAETDPSLALDLLLSLISSTLLAILMLLVPLILPMSCTIVLLLFVRSWRQR